jgi:hypothetical protein
MEKDKSDMESMEQSLLSTEQHERDLKEIHKPSKLVAIVGYVIFILSWPMSTTFGQLMLAENDLLKVIWRH